MAALAPIPSPSETTATAVTSGVRKSVRRACLRERMGTETGEGAAKLCREVLEETEQSSHGDHGGPEMWRRATSQAGHARGRVEKRPARRGACMPGLARQLSSLSPCPFVISV